MDCQPCTSDLIIDVVSINDMRFNEDIDPSTVHLSPSLTQINSLDYFCIDFFQTH